MYEHALALSFKIKKNTAKKIANTLLSINDDGFYVDLNRTKDGEPVIVIIPQTKNAQHFLELAMDTIWDEIYSLPITKKPYIFDYTDKETYKELYAKQNFFKFAPDELIITYAASNVA